MLHSLLIAITVILLSYVLIIWFLNAIDRLYCFVLFLVGFNSLPFFYAYLLWGYYGGEWEPFILRWIVKLYFGVTLALLLGLYIASQISLAVMKHQIKTGTIGKNPLRWHPRLQERIKEVKAKFFQGKVPVKLRPERQKTLNDKIFDPIVDEKVNVIRNHSPEYLLELISLGADFQGRDDYSMTPLMKFAQKGLWKKIAVLLELGVDIEAKDDEGKTAIFYAADPTFDNPKTLHLLIAKGANTKVKDNHGKTPLMHYLEPGRYHKEADFLPYIQHRPILETLLLYSDVNAKDNRGRTPLMYAVEGNDIRAIRKLVKMGARLDEKNRLGKTALMVAVETRKKQLLSDPRKIIKVLIKAGAGLDLKDNKGLTALDLANNYMFTDIEEILKKAGTKSS